VGRRAARGSDASSAQSALGAVHSQVLGAGGRYRDERAALWRAVARDEPPVRRVFPYGKLGARRPPRIEHLGVGPRAGAHPFEEVQDQGLNGVGHEESVSGLPDGDDEVLDVRDTPDSADGRSTRLPSPPPEQEADRS